MPKVIYGGEHAMAALSGILSENRATKVAILTDKGVRAGGLIDRPLEIVHQHGDIQVFTWLVNKRRQTVLQGFIRLFVLGKNYRVLLGTRLRAFHIHLRSSFVATRFLKAHLARF